MVGALLSFSAMAVSIRELSRGGLEHFRDPGDPQRRLAHRSALRCSRCGPNCACTPCRAAWASTSLRNIVHYASQYAWALSLTMLPLATVFALEFTMPAWTALLAVWLLHERMTPSRLGVVVFGLIGVLVILRPGIAELQSGRVARPGGGLRLRHHHDHDQEADHDRDHLRHHLLDGGDPVSALACSAAIPTRSSRISTRATFCPCSASASAGLTSHYCLSNAFRAGDATLVVPLDFMRIPLIAVVGWALLRRGARYFRAARRPDHHRRRALEPAGGKRPRALTPANVILAPP